MSAIDIGDPLSVILSIVQIQHRCHRVHPDSVSMVLLCPEQRIGNQEVRHLWPAIIVDQCSPMRVRTLPWVLVLIDTGSVKTCHAISISREMCRNPVQDHSNPLLMHIVHKVHKIIRSSIPAGRGIIPGHLIPPGSIQGMFHHRHQLHMRISHLFDILCQAHRDFPIIVKFGADCLRPVFRNLKGLANPGTQVQFIDGYRLCLMVSLLTCLHPGIVTPRKFPDIPDNRRIVRTQLRIVCIWVCL